MISLAMDASTSRGTLAVLDGDRVVVQAMAPMRGGRHDAEPLLPAIDRALRDAGRSIEQIDRVICGAGPGSFTSLRVAASVAKGLTLGHSCPLFAVSSLALIVAGNVTDGPRGPRRYLAALDAMRGESYVQEFEHLDGAVRIVGDMRLVAGDAVEALATSSEARAVGPDQVEQWQPHARGVSLLMSMIESQGPVDIAGWEPIYGRLAEAQVKWEATHGRALPR